MQTPDSGSASLHSSLSLQRALFPLSMPSLISHRSGSILSGMSRGGSLHPAFLPAAGVVYPRSAMGVAIPSQTLPATPADHNISAFPGSSSLHTTRREDKIGSAFTIDALLGPNSESTTVSTGPPQPDRLIGHTRGQSRHQPYPVHPPRSGAMGSYEDLANEGHHLYHQSYPSSMREKKPLHGNDLSPLSWKQNKAKRVRTIFTPDQLERLEAEFERQQYMVGTERYYLAASLNLTEGQVKVWFQNRRIKWRKNSLDLQQAKMARNELFTPEGSSEPEEEHDLSRSSDQHRQTTFNHDLGQENAVNLSRCVANDNVEYTDDDFSPSLHESIENIQNTRHNSPLNVTEHCSNHMTNHV